MAVIDEDFKISAANMEFFKLLGYVREEVEDRTAITELLNGNDLERFKQFHTLIWSDSSGPGAKQGMGEYQFITRQGDQKTLLVTVAAIPETDKSVISWLTLPRTGRKRAL